MLSAFIAAVAATTSEDDFNKLFLNIKNEMSKK
jgi:hypothetical protein